MVTFHLGDRRGAEGAVGSWKVVLNEGAQQVTVKVSREFANPQSFLQPLAKVLASRRLGGPKSMGGFGARHPGSDPDSAT